jgi:hypothetical protein
VVVLAPAIGPIDKHACDSSAIYRTNLPRAIADLIRLDGTDDHDIYLFNYDSLVYA